MIKHSLNLEQVVEASSGVDPIVLGSLVFLVASSVTSQDEMDHPACDMNINS